MHGKHKKEASRYAAEVSGSDSQSGHLGPKLLYRQSSKWLLFSNEGRIKTENGEEDRTPPSYSCSTNTHYGWIIK